MPFNYFLITRYFYKIHPLYRNFIFHQENVIKKYISDKSLVLFPTVIAIFYREMFCHTVLKNPRRPLSIITSVGLDVQ